MDNLQNPPSTHSDTSDLQAQYEALRHVIVSILILLLIISGTFTIFLLRQYRSTKADLANAEPQVRQMLAEYTRDSGAMSQFVNQIVDYGRTHPDFTPVLSKFGIKPNGPAPAIGPPPK
jgi:hypothetical protein